MITRNLLLFALALGLGACDSGHPINTGADATQAAAPPGFPG